MIDKLYQHSRLLNHRLSSLDQVINPKPLAKTAAQIEYEYVDLPPPLIPAMQQMTCSKEQFIRLGRLLAFIHSYATPYGSLLHGDYVIHNIFIAVDKIYLIDPHPPEKLPFADEYLYGNPNRELSVFIFSVFGDIGLRKIASSFTKLKYYSDLVCAFLVGYAQEKAGKSASFLSNLACARQLYRLRRASGFSVSSTVLHCFVCFVFSTWSLLRYKFQLYKKNK